MTAIDQDRLQDFVGRAVGDMAVAASGLLVHLGDRLGLYRAMAGAGPLTPEALAEATGTAPRYVREWLGNQAAGGYVVHRPEDGTFELPAEHAAVLAAEQSPFFLGGAYEALASCYSDHDHLAEAFSTGGGFGWERHDHRLFSGVRRLFQPSYTTHLTSDWIPALDGVEDRLKAGASVADIGCGLGASTVIMAQAYSHSTFAGFDYHQPSVQAAQKAAAEAAVQHRVRFQTATADDFPGTGFDLICMFDCLHDMGDPVGAARHVRKALADDGTLMLVEPNAGDTVQDNINPVSRAYYAFSTAICTPASMAQPVGLALGAQAGPARLTQVLTEAGFAEVSEVARTPFHMVLQARP